MICKNCKYEGEDFKYCPDCGVSISEKKTRQEIALEKLEAVEKSVQELKEQNIAREKRREEREKARKERRDAKEKERNSKPANGTGRRSRGILDIF